MDDFKTFPYSNSAILRIADDKEIIETDPEYQRSGNIWDKESKMLLIDSIINGYDIPKLYFHALNKPKNKKKFAIIDGRQRIEAIWEFMDDKFPLSNDFEFKENLDFKAKGLYYSELANKYPKLKIRFDAFTLPIVCVAAADTDVIDEMFSRLNEAVPLNAAEKRKALGGPMARGIDDLTLHSFFTEKIKITNTRYKHNEIAAKFLFLEKNLLQDKKIYDMKKQFLDAMVKDYKLRKQLDTDEITTRVKIILDKMNNIFRSKDVLLASLSVIPVYFLLFRAAYDQEKLKYITRSKIDHFKKMVHENRIRATEDMASADYDLLEYSNHSIQGTAYASSLKERLQIISRYFEIDMIMLK